MERGEQMNGHVLRPLISLPLAPDTLFLFQKAMKRGLDCFDLDCLQAEPVSEVLRVQESLMGLPRSVGDFFRRVGNRKYEESFLFS